MVKKSIERGAHIRIPIRRLGSVIYHHGIDLGNDRVIHFRKEKLFNFPIIRETHISEFGDGKDDQPELVSRSFFSDESVELAKQLLKLSQQCEKGKIDTRAATKKAMEQIKQTQYHILDNNCEHIADYCATGGRSNNSNQANVVKTLLKSIHDNRYTIYSALSQMQSNRV